MCIAQMFSLLEILATVLSAVISYIIGGVNASIIVTKIFDHGRDIRESGSGNAGFTNVLRTKGKKLAVITFIIDFAKGVVAIALTHFIMKYCCGTIENSVQFKFAEYFSCFCCVLGHVYPCFFKFHGGKAILTAWSAMLLIDWRVFIWLISIFLIVLFIKKIVSLASVIAAVLYPVGVFLSTFFFDFAVSGNIYDILIPVFFSFLISSLTIYKHRGNINRILSGKESSISINK